MLTPREIRGASLQRGTTTRWMMPPLQTPQKLQVRGMPWDGDRAAGR